MKQPLIQVYTGDGKGKTTAAIGLITRALGHHFRVKVYQFLKSDDSGEQNSLAHLGVKVIKCSSQDKPSWTMNEEEIEILKEDTLKAWESVVEDVASKQLDILVLDEGNHALYREYITEKQVDELIQQASKTELVFTGRNAPEWLIEKADLVSEIKMIKHPFQQKIGSRLGIEK